MEVNLLFAASAVALYALGYEYDRTHDISETGCYADLCIDMFGERWLRIGELMIGAVLLGDVVLLAMTSIRRLMRANSILSD
jgi:hypothetical protein